MKKLLIFVVLICIFFTNPVYCQDYIRGVIHLHDTDSDGTMPESAVVKTAQLAGCKFVIITNHVECLLGICEHMFIDAQTHLPHQKRKHNDFFQKYFEKNLPINQIRCFEIFTKKDGAHILILGKNFQNFQGKIKSLSRATASEILSFVEENKFISILAHPHDGYDESCLNRFDAIEFFNTKGYAISDPIHLISRYKEAEEINLQIYNQAIKNYLIDRKKLPAIVGGSDAHFHLDEIFFGHTYIRATKGDIDEVLNAICQGKTYAISTGLPGYVVKINELNYHPQKDRYLVDKIHLKAKITIPRLSAVAYDEIKIYLNGNEHLSEQVPAKIYQQQIAYNLDCVIDAKDGINVVYVHIPGRMITSPIVFDVKNIKPKLSTKLIHKLFDPQHKSGYWILELYNDNKCIAKYILISRDGYHLFEDILIRFTRESFYENSRYIGQILKYSPKTNSMKHVNTLFLDNTYQQIVSGLAEPIMNASVNEIISGDILNKEKNLKNNNKYEQGTVEYFAYNFIISKYSTSQNAQHKISNKAIVGKWCSLTVICSDMSNQPFYFLFAKEKEGWRLVSQGGKSYTIDFTMKYSSEDVKNINKLGWKIFSFKDTYVSSIKFY